MNMNNKYPLIWKKDNFSIKIFCSIPNIATGILLKAGKSHFIIDPGDGILRDLNKEIGTKNLLEIRRYFCIAWSSRSCWRGLVFTHLS